MYYMIIYIIYISIYIKHYPNTTCPSGHRHIGFTATAALGHSHEWLYIYTHIDIYIYMSMYM